MIEINVYANGYLVEGHARPDVCDSVSMLSWHLNNLFHDLNILETYYYSTIPDENSKEGLGFGRCKYSPLVALLMDNYFDTVKYWLEKTYPQHVKVYDYRAESFGVGSHIRFYEPGEEYDKQVEEYNNRKRDEK